MKAIPIIAPLLLSQIPHDHVAYAASAEKEQQVALILQNMESAALNFRDEIERVYGERCLESTLGECSEGNYNDCSSVYPNQMCMEADELVMPACGDGSSCNGAYYLTSI